MSTPTSRKVTKQRYTFECMLQEVRMAVRFPCRIAVTWNYGEGEVRSSTSRPLTNGVAKFEEKLSFVRLVTHDDDTRQYYEAKSIVEVSILTDNGTSLAGFVSIDLASIVGRKERRELYEIERCPDKTASIRMRFNCLPLDERSRNQVHLQNHYEEEFDLDDDRMDRRHAQTRRSVTPRSEYHPQTIIRAKMKSPDMTSNQRNKNIMEKQLMILKGRASQMENRYKMERTEKEKLAETLKAKEDIFFTMKTELKRKEIQVADVGRSLEEFRVQYERVKQQNESSKKECEKHQKAMEANNKSAFDRIAKLETDYASLQRKHEKIVAEAEKVRKEKQSMTILHKTKLEELAKDRQAINEQLRVTRKEKDDQARQSKADKTVWEKSMRQSQKRITDLDEQLQTFRSSLQQAERKTGKLDELRNEESTKLKQTIIEIEHVKERLSMDLENVKLASSKKEASLQDTLRSTEMRLTEERNSNSTLKAVVSELQSQLTNLQLDNSSLLKSKSELQERRALLEEDRARIEKECTLLKTQLNSLSEQLHEKNLELRALGTKLREDEQAYTAKLAKSKELADELQENIIRLTEQRKNEQTKNANISKLLSKKEKELEEWIIRENRLNSQVESARQELKKVEAAYREKFEQFKKNEAMIKFSLADALKNNEMLHEKLGNKLAEQTTVNRRLEASGKEQQEIIEAVTSREHELRQECSRLTHELTHLFEARELLQASEEKLRDYEWRIEELSQEIRVRILKEERMEGELTDMKNSAIENQSELMKKENQLKDKEKLLNNHIKQLNSDIEERNKQYSAKETEYRAAQEELRESLRKERTRISELLIDQDRLNSLLLSTQADFEKTQTAIIAFQSEIKLLKESNRCEADEKILLLKKLDEAERKLIDLEEVRLGLELRVTDKEKEIKHLKYAQTESEQRLEDTARSQLRNQQMLTEIAEAAFRLEGRSSNEIIPSEGQFEKLNRIKKLLTLAESRVKKLVEMNAEKEEIISKERSKELSAGEKTNAQLAALRMETVQLKKDLDETAYSANFLKIQNEQLLQKSQHLEHDLSASKKNIFQMEMRIKAQSQEKEQLEDDFKAATAKYESLLEEARATLSEKAEKQRRELTATIKRLEQKTEEQHERIFALELECQKLGELARLQQENRRLSTRVFELQKENLQIIQSSSAKLEKLETQMDSEAWEKKLQQQNHNSFLSKNEKVLAGLHSQVEQLTSKNKILQQQLRTSEEQLRKLEETVNKGKNDLAAAKTLHRDDHDKWLNVENKLKADNTKLRTENAQLRKSVDELGHRVAQLQEMRSSKSSLQEQLARKDELLHASHQKEESLSERLFQQTQKLQEQKYTYEKLLETKESEIVSIQEELFKVNSKENMRYLKENDVNEKLKHIQNEKRMLARELQEMRISNEQLQEELKMLQNENEILQDQLSQSRLPAWPNPNQKDQLVSKLEMEVEELREENSRMRCSDSAFRMSSEI